MQPPRSTTTVAPTPIQSTGSFNEQVMNSSFKESSNRTEENNTRQLLSQAQNQSSVQQVDTFEQNFFREESKTETNSEKILQKELIEESKFEETIHEFESQVREMELSQMSSDNTERTQKFLSNESFYLSLFLFN